MDPIARMEFERAKAYPLPPYDPNFIPAYPESSEFPIDQFTSLRLSNINPKIPDEEVREAVYQFFKRTGEFNIKFAHTVDRRLVYVNFAYSEDAQVARNISFNRLELFDRPICVETVNHNKAWGKTSYFQPAIPPVPAPFPPTAMGTGFRPFEAWEPQRKEMHFHEFQEHQEFPARMGEEGKPFMDIKHISPEEDRRATRTLFVANVDDKMDPQELKRYFDPFGIVEDIDIKCPIKGTGNPYAFLRFYNLDMAFAAKLELSGKFLGKHQCKIGYARPVPTTCVWVGGLTEDSIKQDILAQFERFGNIVDFKWPKGKSYAYIAYDNVDSAQMAILELRGFPLAGTMKGLRTDFTELKQMEGPQPREHKIKKKHKHRNRSRSSSENEKKRKSKRNRKHSKITDTDDSSSSGSKKRRRKKRKVSSSRSESSISDSDHADSFDKKRSVFQIANIDAAETIVDMARCLPVVWSGPIELKNSAFYTQMHLVSGNGNLVDGLLSGLLSHDYPALKINQRLRLDRSKLKEVEKRINQSGIGGHCVLLAVSENNKDSNKFRPLTNLVSYLKQKNAAGVLSLPSMSRQGQEVGLLHTFPPCEFAHEYLLRCAPKLTSSYNNNDYIVIILVKVNL